MVSIGEWPSEVWTPVFRWGQHAVIDTVLAGTHTLAIMPTGEIVQWKER